MTNPKGGSVPWLAAGRALLRGDPAPGQSAVPGRLAQALGLDPAEQSLLVMLAVVEADPQALGEQPAAELTVADALARCPGLTMRHLAPSASLRRLLLVELSDHRPLWAARLRLDEWALHHVLGSPFVDPRLLGRCGVIASTTPLPSGWAGLLEEARRTSAEGEVPLLVGEGREAVAERAARAQGRAAWRVRASDLDRPDRDLLRALLQRELLATGALLYLELDVPVPGLADWARSLGGALAGAGTAVAWLGPRLDLPVLRVNDREELLRVAFRDAPVNGEIHTLALRYRLGPDALAAVAAAIPAGVGAAEAVARATEVCRVQAREVLDGLARRVDARARWDDLVLPPPSLATLRELVLHLRHRSRVHDDWGFAARSSRGLGLVAMFAGPSGTGKTMAAEVLAEEFGLDLYCIDLSAVVSKYIGETEKNLARLFDAAERCGAVLLFDEADALFGKRSEVRDSHDRYANIEVGFLLTRMEAYRGLAILTTNLKESLDTAFLRRLTFVVDFPTPDAALRAELWRRILPVELPRERIDIDALASLPFTGGHIRSVAMRAAFVAAEEGGRLTMPQLVRAARAELQKLGRPVPREWSV